MMMMMMMMMIYGRGATPPPVAYELKCCKSLKVVQDHSQLHVLVGRV